MPHHHFHFIPCACLVGYLYIGLPSVGLLSSVLMHISNVINLLNSEPELNLCVLESIEGLDRLDFSVRVCALLWWQSTEGLSSLLSYHTWCIAAVQTFLLLDLGDDLTHRNRILPFLFSVPEQFQLTCRVPSIPVH